MKRFLSMMGSLIGLLTVGALVITLVVNLQDPIHETDPSSVAFQSPIESPTIPAPTPTEALPTPTPTKWRPTPKSTPIRSGGPTPTPLPPIPPAPDASGTIWFFRDEVTKDGEVVRRLVFLPVDAQGRTLREEPVVPLADWNKWPVDSLPEIVPAPRGPYLAIIQPPPPGRGLYSTVTFVDRKRGKVLPFEPIRQGAPYLGRFAGWHPDGRHILFIGQDTDQGLWLVNVEGQEPAQQLAEHTPDSAAISPDGQRLVSAGNRQNIVNDQLTYENGVWLAWADGSHERKVVDIDPRLDVFNVSWSPDNSRFLYLKGTQVWMIDADGTNNRMLTDNWASGWGFPPPSWSPNGQFIAFPAQEITPEKSDEDAYWGIGALRYVAVHVLDVQTGEEWRLVNEQREGSMEPVWSPDGSMLAYLADWSGVPEIWMSGQDGVDSRAIAKSVSGPIWFKRGD